MSTSTKPKPRTMIRLSLATEEKAAKWAAILGTSRGKLLGIALDQWEQRALEITPRSGTDAKN